MTPALGAPIALHAAADAAVPEWVHVLPAGAMTGRDGRAFVAGSLPTIIAASLRQAPAKTLPIDYDHQIDLAPKHGGSAPAAGWMTALQARTDGIWARVEWTPRAREKVAAREYRFLSPVFMHTPKGEVLTLLRAALTNNPNLGQLTALNATGTPMDLNQLLAALRELLKLPADADAAAVVDAVRSQGTAMNTPDPARFVPIELFQQAVKEARKADLGLSAAEAERAVQDAIRDRKIMPWMKGWAVSLCATNAPAFKDFVEGIGPSLNSLLTDMATPRDWSKHLAGDGARSGPPGVADIAARVGVTAEDLAKYGK